MRQVMLFLGSVLDLHALVWGQQSPSWESWGMHPMWGVWGIGMMLFMLVFWGSVIAGIVLPYAG